MSKHHPDYASVSIPKNLVETIEKLLEENDNLGYRTKAEFVAEAVRIHLKVTIDLINSFKKKLINSNI